MNDEHSVVTYKIILLGEKNVGKSALINRYILGQFDPFIEGTIGTAFYAKSLSIDNKFIKLMIWDTCGEEKFRSISSLYFKDSDAAILVYDLTSPPSLEGVEYYIEQLGINSPEDTMIAVCGNKVDLMDENTSIINIDSIEEKLQDMNGFYTVTSAKSGCGIDKLFEKIANYQINQDKMKKTGLDELVNINKNKAVGKKSMLYNDSSQCKC